MNLHHSSSSPSAETSRSSSRQLGRHCGSINTNVVQQVVAAKWATDVINNQSLPYELKIGELQFASLAPARFFPHRSHPLGVEHVGGKCGFFTPTFLPSA